MGQRLRLRTKLTMMCAFVLVFTLTLLLPEAAFAHRPLFTNTDASDPGSAIRIPDPSVSHVIYAELTEGEPHRWFVFDNDNPQEVPMQVGVPVAVSQGDIEPSIMLFGPGWPDLPQGFPFPPPQGEGVGAITVPIAERPHRFYEPVTGTESHILVDTAVELLEAGTYYGVVYEERGQQGKVWVSIGQSEGFSWRDVSRLPEWIGDVRRFHEVSGWPRWAWIGTLGLPAIALAVMARVRRRRR